MTKRIEVEKLASYTGHRDCLYSLEGSSGDDSFFSAGADGLVARWDRKSPDQGQLVARIPNTVYALCLLQEQQQLVVGQNYAGIHLIDLKTNQEIASLKLTDKPVFDIQFVDQTIVVTDGGGAVYLVDYPQLTIRRKMQYSKASARCVAVNPGQREIAVGYSDDHIRRFCLDTADLKQEFKAHDNSVFCLTYSTDCRYLLSGGRDAHMKVWDVAGHYGLYQDIVAHMYTINHIAFREDGRFFVTCSKDKSVKVWDAHAFKLLKVIDKARHAGHGTSVNKLLWLSDTEVASCSDDRIISLWKLHNLPE